MDREKKSEELQVVVFALGNEEFGTEISKVREIIRLSSITHLPNTPDFVEGIINIRGQIVAVVDLRKRFTVAAGNDDSTRIILVEIGDSQVGLIVDSVTEVLTLSRKDIEPAPKMISGIKSDFINGIGKREERLVILLDVAKILTAEERIELNSAIPTEA